MIFSDVVVVGGGFTGLASAAALAAAGARVTVLEALAGPMPAFRGELLHPRGARTLSALGLFDVVPAVGAVEIRGFAAFEGRGGEAVLLPYPRHAEPGIGFDHGDLVQHLRRVVAARPGVEIVTGARVERVLYEQGRPIGVECAGGLARRAPLLVGADGRNSKLRRLLGIPANTSLLSQMVVVGLEGELLPWSDRGHVFAGPPGPALAYPYAAGKVRMCIDVPHGAARGRAAIASYVRREYVRFLPADLGDALVAALERGDFSGSANHAVYTATCVAPGAALVGDAGGCSHPLTATGMTAALHDVVTLAECLSARGTDGNVGALDASLGEYEKRRYRFVRAREVFAHAMYEVFRDAGPGALALREGMFRYWRESERARGASMQILSGDDSRVTSFLAEYARVMGSSARSGSSVWRVGRMLAASVEGLRPLLHVARMDPRLGSRVDASPAPRA